MIYGLHNKVVNSDIWIIHLLCVYDMYLNMNSEQMTFMNKKQIFIKNLIYNLDVFNFEIREKSMFILWKC